MTYFLPNTEMALQACISWLGQNVAQTPPSENSPIGKGFSHFSKCFLKHSSSELQPAIL